MSDETEKSDPKWQKLGRIERRIIGVLVEKAKTTPNAYPMTLNALTTGCNQKSNRYPEMNLQPHQVEDALETLRSMGAVAEIAGSGRVPKYRHYMYEWLGVEQAELAVMAELLLRGGQTIGELRGRAARMDKIEDLNALRPMLSSLIEKGLVVALTPEGRGQTVTHGLFKDEEMEKERSRLTANASADTAAPASATSSSRPGEGSASAASASASTTSSASSSEIESLRKEVAELKEVVEKMKSEINDIWSNFQ